MRLYFIKKENMKKKLIKKLYIKRYVNVRF